MRTNLLAAPVDPKPLADKVAAIIESRQTFLGLDVSYGADVATMLGLGIAGVAAIIALIQYISSSRATDRAHMHSVFRDYLALRATIGDENHIRIIGYRYYAMEEVFLWIKRQRRKRLLLLRMPEKEHDDWINTIKHHILPDKDSAGHRYFLDNEKIFGDDFREFVKKELGETCIETLEKSKVGSDAGENETVMDRVKALLTDCAPNPICDDCIAQKLDLSVRQHANHKTRELAEQAGFHRQKGQCSICKATKKVIHAQ